MWFHVECLEGPDSDVEEKNEEDTDAEEDNQVLRIVDPTQVDEEGILRAWRMVLEVPTVCSHNGHYDFDNNWLNTGSGTQKQLVKGWKAEKTIPEDWMAKLGEGFLIDLARMWFR